LDNHPLYFCQRNQSTYSLKHKKQDATHAEDLVYVHSITFFPQRVKNIQKGKQTCEILGVMFMTVIYRLLEVLNLSLERPEAKAMPSQIGSI